MLFLVWAIHALAILLAKSPRPTFKHISSAVLSSFPEFNTALPRPVKRLVVTIFDALRWDWLKAQDPLKSTIPETGLPFTPLHNQYRFANNLTATLPDHARMVRMYCEFPTMTAVRIQAMGRGIIPDWLDTSRSLRSGHRPQLDDHTSIFSSLKQAGLRTAFAGDFSWMLEYQPSNNKPLIDPAVSASSMTETDVNISDKIAYEILWRLLHTAATKPRGYNYTYADVRHGMPDDRANLEIQGIKPSFPLASVAELSLCTNPLKIQNDWDVVLTHWLGADSIGHVYQNEPSVAVPRHQLFDQVISNVLWYLSNQTIGRPVLTSCLFEPDTPDPAVDGLDYNLPNFDNRLRSFIRYQTEVFNPKIDSVTAEFVPEAVDTFYTIFAGDHGTTDVGVHGGDSKTEREAGLLIYSSLLLNPTETLPEEWLSDGIPEFDGQGDGIRQLDMTSTMAVLMGVEVPAVNIGLPAVNFLPFYPFTAVDKNITSRPVAQVANLRYLAHWHEQVAEKIIRGVQEINLPIRSDLLAEYNETKRRVMIKGVFFDNVALGIRETMQVVSKEEFSADELEDYAEALRAYITSSRRVARFVTAEWALLITQQLKPVAGWLGAYVPAVVWSIIFILPPSKRLDGKVKIVEAISTVVGALTYMGYISLSVAAVIPWLEVVILVASSNHDIRSAMTWKVGRNAAVIIAVILIYFGFLGSHTWNIWKIHVLIPATTLELGLVIALLVVIRGAPASKRAMKKTAEAEEILSLWKALSLWMLCVVLMFLCDPLVQSEEGTILGDHPWPERHGVHSRSLAVFGFAAWMASSDSPSKLLRAVHIAIACLICAHQHAVGATKSTRQWIGHRPWALAVGRLAFIDDSETHTNQEIYSFALPRFMLVLLGIAVIGERVWKGSRKPSDHRRRWWTSAESTWLWIPVILRPYHTVHSVVLLVISIRLLDLHIRPKLTDALSSFHAADVYATSAAVLTTACAVYSMGIRPNVQSLPFTVGLTGLQHYHAVISISLVVCTCAWPFIYTAAVWSTPHSLAVGAWVLLILGEQWQTLFQSGTSALQIIVSQNSESPNFAVVAPSMRGESALQCDLDVYDDPDIDYQTSCRGLDIRSQDKSQEQTGRGVAHQLIPFGTGREKNAIQAAVQVMILSATAS